MLNGEFVVAAETPLLVGPGEIPSGGNIDGSEPEDG